MDKKIPISNDAHPGRLLLASSDSFEERDTGPLLPTYKTNSIKPDMFRRHACFKAARAVFRSENRLSEYPPSLAIITNANPGLCYETGSQRDGGSDHRLFLPAWQSVFWVDHAHLVSTCLLIPQSLSTTHLFGVLTSLNVESLI